MARTFESIPELMEAYPKYFKPHAAEGTSGVVQLHLSGAGGGDYYMVIENQELTIEEGTHDAPDTTVEASAETWLKINNGEVHPMQMMMQGKTKVRGSLPLVMKLQTLFERPSERPS